MYPHDLEPESEDFLLRLAPDLAQKWRGASDDQIHELERIARRPLPRFYRWFALRMGKSVGSLRFRSLDFSVERVLSCYADGLVTPGPRFFMIAFETDEVMPLHIFYDFDHPAREDARVVAMGFDRVTYWESFDTFREMLIWGQFIPLGINKKPQRCRGLFHRSGEETLPRLDVAMKALGFSKPVPMGVNCAVYERSDAGMTVSATPGKALSQSLIFRLGATDAGTVRRILGMIANDLSVEIKIEEWTPPLPDPIATP